MHILFVDDNSPDNTAEIIQKECQKHSNIHLITGEKKGLGAAYIRGMQYAADCLKADVLMEMDADFSHKPEDIPRLLSAIDKGADFVIGSRYVRGGKIPRDWAFWRKLNSKWGNFFARYIAGLYKIRDCTAGFRAIRVSVIKKIYLTNLKVKGYAFQIALLHRAVASHAVVREVPVEFIDRVEGETKLGLADILEFIINVFWIRFNNSRTFIRFAIVGTSGVVVNLTVFTVLVHSGINKFIASPVATEVSILSNFLLNNFWTFRERISKDIIPLKGLKFNVVSLIALGFSFFTFILLSFLFPDAAPQVHQAIGIIPATLINYFLNSYWTFKDHDHS